MTPLISLSILGITFSLFIFFYLRKRKFGVFHLGIILIALSVLDVFIPALMWSIYGMPETKPAGAGYLLDNEIVFNGMVFYLLFYLIMFVFIVHQPHNVNNNTSTSVAISKKRLKISLLICLLLATSSLLITIGQYGGVMEWFWGKVQFRWEASTVAHTGNNFLETVILSFDWRIILNLLILAALYYRDSLNNNLLYKWILPLIAILFSFTTFFRGSILLLIFGFIFVEMARLQYGNIQSKLYKALKNNKKKTIQGFVLAVGLFVTYGVIRDTYSAKTWDEESTSSLFSGLYNILSQGEGLSSISYIVNDYSSTSESVNVSHLNGKTYIDMLLLPVPRSIYLSKPEWYGITDITLAMGWFRSSQSAVSIPGEAFANFGWVGLLMAPVFGSLFRFLYLLSARVGSKYLLIYPGITIYMLFIGNWMSFTGIMTQIPSFIIMMLLLKFIINITSS